MQETAAQVPELPRELVVAIASARPRTHRVLTTMLQVCRAWRNALNAEIASLWRVVGPAVMVMSEFQRYLAWFAVW